MEKTKQNKKKHTEKYKKTKHLEKTAQRIYNDSQMKTRETTISHNKIDTQYVHDNHNLSLQYEIVHTVRKPHYLTFQVKLILEHQIDNLDRGLLKAIQTTRTLNQSDDLTRTYGGNGQRKR